ncbi:hypothetical protein GCM10010466_29630 [Planomonospora alba]|uniref:Uncharacterized protein n=1 Tax=Planomonospora alba TaxID=161354 RepID=A0ABP6N6Z8_9ACTN
MIASLPRGTRVLMKLIKAGIVSHAIGTADIDDLPAEYTATVEAAARLWESGDELALNAMVYALMFQVSMDDGEGTDH